MNKYKQEPVIFNKGTSGRKGVSLPDMDVPEHPISSYIPEQHLRDQAPELPELSELEVVRHYTRLSQKNYSIDTDFYPLGSCTMKYNPKINEQLAHHTSFQHLHPLQPEDTTQGMLEVQYQLQELLKEITGMRHFALSPAAGAQGELTGLMMIRSRLEDEGEEQRDQILLPDSAHGTNPASSSICGFDTVEIPTNEQGRVDMESLREALHDQVAGLMITNPSTLGLFENNIEMICELVHEAGGYVYMDGANFNAILGFTRPGDFGADILHLNLHKTFSTPHGAGGPGSGPVGVTDEFSDYLPPPIVRQDSSGRYELDHDLPQSIGKVKGFHGHALVHLRAFCYIMSQGSEGLKNVSKTALLNANYLLEQMPEELPVAFDNSCMHEFVLDGSFLKKQDCRTLDVAKRLLDYGFHPPTIYFPMIVKEALMIEPTETESRETLDQFADAMHTILDEVKHQPEKVTRAPHKTPVRRVDEVQAARQPDLRWEKKE